jgi:arylsulfatase A-like enzyme
MLMRTAMLALLTAVCFSPLTTHAAPLNVVMIISDDQTWTDFGFMGHKIIKTPRLDRLSTQSAVFPRGYVPSSLCRASLATLVTGLYPHQNKILGNDPRRGVNRRLMLKHIQAAPTLPRMLGKQGYLSHQSGKWWEGNHKLGGFTHGMTHGDPKRGGRHGDLGLKIGRTGMKPITDFIDGCGENPFFLWYAPFLPHRPHNPPAWLLKKYKDKVDSPHVAKYYAMCEWFDETCGQLLDYLDTKKLSDNTLVVFVTDNGWIQRTNGSGYAPKSKRSPNDGGVRTPIMLRWPGKIKPAKYDMPVISVDLAPTILAACGLKPDAAMQGINLLDICAGKQPTRKAVFGEVFAHDQVDIDDPVPSLLYRWCVQDRWKLILSAKSANPQLFDILADPHETKNLAAANAAVVKQLTDATDQWWPGK